MMNENTKQKLILKILNMFSDFDEEDWKNVKFSLNSTKDVNNYNEYYILTYNIMELYIHYYYNLKDINDHLKMNSVSNNIPALKRSYRVLKNIGVYPDINDEDYFIELDKITKDIANKANDVACKCMIYKKDDLAKERINTIVDEYYKSKKRRRAMDKLYEITMADNTKEDNNYER